MNRSTFFVAILADDFTQVTRSDLVDYGYLIHHESVAVGHNKRTRERFIVDKPFLHYGKGDIYEQGR